MRFVHCCVVFFFKQKTAYEMRISDWSSDVCSSDLYFFELGKFEAFLREWLAGDAAQHVQQHAQAEPGAAPGPWLQDFRQLRREPVARQEALEVGLEIGRASCRERGQ